MDEIAGLYLIVRGRVQGVFFRYFVSREARELGLKGYVCNLPDGNSVEICAEGEKVKLERLIQTCRRGPPGARVEEVIEEWKEAAGAYISFEIEY